MAGRARRRPAPARPAERRDARVDAGAVGVTSEVGSSHGVTLPTQAGCVPQRRWTTEEVEPRLTKTRSWAVEDEGFFKRPSAEEMAAGRPKVARTALKRYRKFMGHASDADGRGRPDHASSYQARARSWLRIAHAEMAKMARSGMSADEIAKAVNDNEYDAEKVQRAIQTTTLDE